MKYLLILIFLSISSMQALCQTDDIEENKNIIVTLQNGKKVKGKVKTIELETITIESELGEIVINRKNIKKHFSSNSKEDVENKIYRYFNDSYFLFPSALPVGKGNSHYKNINLFYNQFNIGLTDNFSLGAGFESFSFFNGQFSQLFFIAPKASIGSGNNHIGIGTTLYIIPSIDGIAGLTYLNYTIGNHNKNLTIGGAIAYAKGENDTETIFNIDVMYPVSNKVIFISELIMGSFDAQVLNLGLRFITKSGISIDASAIKPFQDSGIFAFPMFGITLPFK